MTKEYCKCKYLILLKVLVISHFAFLICHKSLTEKDFLMSNKLIYKNEFLLV